MSFEAEIIRDLVVEELREELHRASASYDTCLAKLVHTPPNHRLDIERELQYAHGYWCGLLKAIETARG